MGGTGLADQDGARLHTCTRRSTVSTRAPAAQECKALVGTALSALSLVPQVYSSSLMEANFLSIAQRREFAVKAVEEAQRLQTIQQLSNAIERKDDFLSTMSHVRGRLVALLHHTILWGCQQQPT